MDSNIKPLTPDLDICRLEPVENVHWDEVDQQLVHALTVAPRAPFKALADAIGVSDQTVGRRYRKLASTVGLRVLAVVNAQRAGWADWIVRLQVTPGSADALGDALARRPDTRWVRLLSGGTEIFCSLQARTPQQRDDLLLRGLPGSRRVTAIAAHSILHVYSPVEWTGMASALTGDQLARLRPFMPSAVPAASCPGEIVQLRPDDDVLLAELARDARTSNSALAATLHWHESTVRRRIEDLACSGLIYFDVDIDDAFIGVHVGAMLWLTVAPEHLDAAGRALASHPEVPFAAATTGPTNLAVSAVFRDTRHLYEYLTTELPGVPGVQSMETAPVIRTLKRTGQRELVAGEAGRAVR